MNLVHATPDYTRWKAVHRLIQQAFAYMEPRLGHPAHATQLTATDLASEAGTATVFLIVAQDRPVACLFCRPARDHPKALYLGKLAVAAGYRGAGLARRLVTAAENEARARGLSALTLDTGAAFPELHDTFQRLGFGPPVPRNKEPDVVTMIRPL